MKRETLVKGIGCLAAFGLVLGLILGSCSWPLGNARSEEDFLNSIVLHPTVGSLRVNNGSVTVDKDGNPIANPVRITGLFIAPDEEDQPGAYVDMVEKYGNPETDIPIPAGDSRTFSNISAGLTG